MKLTETFFFLMMRRAKLRHSAFDFQKERMDSLSELTPYLPDQPIRHSKLRQWILCNPYIKRWVSEVAHLKHALRLKGRHLAVPHLRLCYIRIPKAASTSLSYAMLKANLPGLERSVLSPQQINFLADHFLSEKMQAAETEWTFFTVVRNPFERIVSVYRAFFEREQEAFLYEDYLFGILRKDLSFRKFVKSVFAIPNFLKDPHFRPQHLLLEYYERKRASVQVLRFEELQELHTFLQKFGLALDHIHGQTVAYDYRIYYDPETVDLVSKIYTGDICRFGYNHVRQEIINHHAWRTDKY